MPKDKQGNKITWKEFFKRWKEGIDGITPKQKIQTQFNGTIIQLTGILFGLAISIIGYKQLWWLGIILLGASINTGVQLIGLRQQIKNMKKWDNTCEEKTIEELLNNEEEK